MKTAHYARPVYPTYRDLTSRHPLRTLAACAVVVIGLAAASEPLVRFVCWMLP